MNIKFLGFLLFASALFFLSCNDDPECTVSGVTGMYTGNHTCNPGEIVDVSITVTASGEELTFLGNDGTTWTTTLDGCATITSEMSILEIDIKIDADFTETELNVTIETTEMEITETCSFQLLKQ